MASNINSNNINILYPIAGQDNDTQGFRDNFRNIRNNLATAQVEISALQASVILSPRINFITGNAGNISVPTTSTTNGYQGQLAWNALSPDYLYVCVRGNGVTATWARTPLQVWPETGNTVTNGNTISNGGQINTNYFIANVSNNQNLFANISYTKFIANTNPANAKIANLWITLPSTAENGRIIEITSLANIASCFVNQNGQPVLYQSNTHFSTGNVTGITSKFTYSTVTNKWMKF